MPITNTAINTTHPGCRTMIPSGDHELQLIILAQTKIVPVHSNYHIPNNGSKILLLLLKLSKPHQSGNCSLETNIEVSSKQTWKKVWPEYPGRAEKYTLGFLMPNSHSSNLKKIFANFILEAYNFLCFWDYVLQENELPSYKLYYECLYCIFKL